MKKHVFPVMTPKLSSNSTMEIPFLATDKRKAHQVHGEIKVVPITSVLCTMSMLYKVRLLTTSYLQM